MFSTYAGFKLVTHLSYISFIISHYWTCHLWVVYFATQYLHYTVSNDRIIHEKLIGKELEGRGEFSSLGIIQTVLGFRDEHR
jgi:hypothetical protein